jgi:hypothetical protein
VGRGGPGRRQPRYKSADVLQGVGAVPRLPGARGASPAGAAGCGWAYAPRVGGGGGGGGGDGGGGGGVVGGGREGEEGLGPVSPVRAGRQRGRRGGWSWRGRWRGAGAAGCVVSACLRISGTNLVVTHGCGEAALTM